MEDPRRNRKWQGRFDALLVVLFVLGIGAPAVRQITGESSSGRDAVREQRRAAKLPPLGWDWRSLAAFPVRFEKYESDAFGFRRRLVRWHNVLKWFVLRTSPDETLVKGRDDWLFFSAMETLHQVRGARPFDEGELEGWRRMLEERRDWLAERGIDYLFVLCPSKSQIYPEFLPRGYERVGRSRFDQLLAYLAEHSDVPVVDLRGSLLAAKRDDRPEVGDYLFYPLGTHYTARGSYVCYTEIMSALRVRWGTLPVLAPTDFKTVLSDEQGDSWAERLYLDDRLHQDDWKLIARAPAVKRRKIEFARIAERFEQPGTDLPRVVLFHDSYASWIKPALARSCALLACFWQYNFDLARVAEERPDVVIDLMVERVLTQLDPPTFMLDSDASLSERFEAAEVVLSVDPLAAGALPGPLRPRAFRRIESGAQRGLAILPRDHFRLLDLPRVRYTPFQRGLLRLDLTAPAETTLEVVFERESGRFPRAFQKRVRVHPGRQVVVVPIRPSNLGGIRLGCELTEGTWILHRAEFREE